MVDGSNRCLPADLWVGSTTTRSILICYSSKEIWMGALCGQVSSFSTCVTYRTFFLPAPARKYVSRVHELVSLLMMFTVGYLPEIPPRTWCLPPTTTAYNKSPTFTYDYHIITSWPYAFSSASLCHQAHILFHEYHGALLQDTVCVS